MAATSGRVAVAGGLAGACTCAASLAARNRPAGARNSAEAAQKALRLGAAGGVAFVLCIKGMCAVPRLFTVWVSISVKSAVTSILCVECHNLESVVILVF